MKALGDLSKIYALSDTDLAYLAGLIDGEGAIGICRATKCTQGYKSMELNGYLCLSNTDIKMINWLSLKIGSKTVQEVRAKNPKHSLVYRWNCPRNVLIELLERLLPYLITKRSRALLLIEFRRGVQAQGGTSKLSQEELDRRENIYQRYLLAKAEEKQCAA